MLWPAELMWCKSLQAVLLLAVFWVTGRQKGMFKWGHSLLNAGERFYFSNWNRSDNSGQQSLGCSICIHHLKVSCSLCLLSTTCIEGLFHNLFLHFFLSNLPFWFQSFWEISSIMQCSSIKASNGMCFPTNMPEVSNLSHFSSYLLQKKKWVIAFQGLNARGGDCSSADSFWHLSLLSLFSCLQSSYVSASSWWCWLSEHT